MKEVVAKSLLLSCSTTFSSLKPLENPINGETASLLSSLQRLYALPHPRQRQTKLYSYRKLEVGYDQAL